MVCASACFKDINDVTILIIHVVHLCINAVYNRKRSQLCVALDFTIPTPCSRLYTFVCTSSIQSIVPPAPFTSHAPYKLYMASSGPSQNMGNSMPWLMAPSPNSITDISLPLVWALEPLEHSAFVHLVSISDIIVSLVSPNKTALQQRDSLHAKRQVIHFCYVSQHLWKKSFATLPS